MAFAWSDPLFVGFSRDFERIQIRRVRRDHHCCECRQYRQWWRPFDCPLAFRCSSSSARWAAQTLWTRHSLIDSPRTITHTFLSFTRNLHDISTSTNQVESLNSIDLVAYIISHRSTVDACRAYCMCMRGTAGRESVTVTCLAKYPRRLSRETSDPFSFGIKQIYLFSHSWSLWPFSVRKKLILYEY